MKRVVTGVKPSGELTLGNYLGAMKHWAQEQHGRENYYFIPNLHALNARPEPKALADNTTGAVAWLLAVGVDPNAATIFVQSDVPAHSELAWILNNYVTMGELSRMTQFKDKSHKTGSEGQVVGLFQYPVLMAADILLYDADEVPVGDDQKQHVELTRDIAERFNNLYGHTFKLPQPIIPKMGARIMNLQEPTVKMSKSDADNSGNIMLMDDPETIRAKIRRAVTDSGEGIKASADKPAITNLIHILGACTDQTVEQIERHNAGKGYAEFKADVAEAVVEALEPLQTRYQDIQDDKSQIAEVLADGATKAGDVAHAKLLMVKEKLGLV